MDKAQKYILLRIIFAFFGLLTALLFRDYIYIKIILCAISLFLVGYDIFIEFLEKLIKLDFFDEDFLITVSSLGAFILGEYFEGVVVLSLFRVGELFEDIAVDKSKKHITELMNIRPEYANLKVDNNIIKVFPDDVNTGDIIVVYPGEKIPLDGEVIFGESSVDNVKLTGESMPTDIFVGDKVISGSVNLSGTISVKAEKKYTESNVSKILNLIENANDSKSKSEKFISKFAKIYTPIVVCLAFVITFIPSFFSNFQNFGMWVYRALSFLVISCPCALVISVPLSFFATVGSAGKHGILIKGSNYIEAVSKISTVAFDKTGTLTKGVFEVVGVHHTPQEKEKTIEYAAVCESNSSHPIAKSVVKHYNKPIDTNRIKSLKEFTGRGIVAVIDDKNVIVGNDILMKEHGVDFVECNSAGSIVHVAVDNEYFGHILISDTLKPNADKAVKALRKCGVNNISIVSGDKHKVVEEISKDVNADNVYSELLPDEKVDIVKKLSLMSKGKTAFVGDGINDAPVIAASDVGFAMGALGSDAAIEAADVVIMDDNLMKISTAIRLSRKCMKTVYENIVFSILAKILCLLFVSLGNAGMWTAIAADVGVMILCVMNSVRTLNIKNKE